MIAHPLIAAAVLLSMSVSAAASASDQVYVEPATGSGASDSDLATTTQLIIASVGEVSRDTVVDQPDSADIILRPTLLRLGQAYLLGISRVRDGKIVSSSQLKAERMDELDKVAERLTRSVLLGEKAKDNPRVGEITDQEAKDGAQRRPSRTETCVSFGASGLSNLNSSGLGYSLGLARAWDVNVALVKLIADFDINGGAWFGSAGLGGNYFLATTDVAPYVTADFGAGLAKLDGGGLFDGQLVGGFVAGGGAGVQFLRTSSVNLDVGFRASVLLRANALGLPEAFSLRLGFYF